MIRKLALVGAAVAMPLALLIPASHAAAPAVDVSNDTVTCNTINKGVIKIKPPLVNGGTTPAVVSVQAKLAGCTTSASVTINDFKSSIKGTLNTTSNDCAGLLSPGAVTGSVVVKWNATPKITPNTSTITIGSGDVTTGVYSAAWGGGYGYFGLGPNPRPTGTPGTPVDVSGAFTGGDSGHSSTADILLQEDLAVLIAQCSTGLKQLTIGLGQLQLS